MGWRCGDSKKLPKRLLIYDWITCTLIVCLQLYKRNLFCLWKTSARECHEQPVHNMHFTNVTSLCEQTYDTLFCNSWTVAGDELYYQWESAPMTQIVLGLQTIGNARSESKWMLLWSRITSSKKRNRSVHGWILQTAPSAYVTYDMRATWCKES